MDENLLSLREKILASKAQRVEKENLVEEERKVNILAEYSRRVLCSVSDITEEDGSEFNLERHTQLCNRVNTRWGNLLYWKQEKNWEEYERSVLDLTNDYQELLLEGNKIKWS